MSGRVSRAGLLNGSCAICRTQEVEAGSYAFGLLQGEAIEIAAADELLDLRGAFGIEAETFERLAPEQKRRLVGLAHLEIDALAR